MLLVFIACLPTFVVIVHVHIRAWMQSQRFCRVRHLWGRDTGCVLKPLATLFSFDTDKRRHTLSSTTNGTRSVDQQGASIICAHIGRI